MNDNKPKDYFKEALDQVPEPESFPGQHNLFAGLFALAREVEAIRGQLEDLSRKLDSRNS
jgi:hypothetical protein